MTIKTKRIYDEVEEKDGIRILVDRLWPRGVSKKKAKLDYWLKHIAPSDELRKKFHQDQLSFNEFKKRYKQEMTSGDALESYNKLKEIISSKNENVTLLYAAKEETYNNAEALKEIVTKR